MTTQAPLIPLKKEKSFYTWAGVVLTAVAVWMTGIVAEFNLWDALKALPGVAHFLWTDFLPPNPKAIPNMIPPLLDTICMAIISTVTSAVLGLILALLCAEPTTPHPAVRIGIRAFASILRNIPGAAWALLLVPAFGIGKFVGVLALTIGSLGGIIRFFTETVEEIDRGGIEAIKAAGGSYWQILRGGVFPQCTPGLIAWTLYNMELDIRASTIIGMMGGGGIGLFIQSSIKLFRYDHAMMAIAIVTCFVLLFEIASKKIREEIL